MTNPPTRKATAEDLAGPLMDTAAALASSDQRARFWEREARNAEQSRNRWRDFALALSAEYTRELGHEPHAQAPA
jgi:hypothetical protein